MTAIPRELNFEAPSLRNSEQRHKITCYEWGAANNPEVLVCVHGLTRNGRDFDFLAQALSEKYRIICPDMPGRGKSQWLQDPQDYTYPQYFSDLLVMFKELGITSCSWVGTSMGGILGMMIAAFHPDKIKRLVLNDVGALVAKVGLDRIASYAGVSTTFSTRALAEESLRTIFTSFGVHGDDQWNHLFEHTLRTNDQGQTVLSYDPDIVVPFKGETKNYTDIKPVELWPLWKGVYCPVLILRGEKSDILLRETAITMLEHGPQVKLVEIPNVGHAPTLFEPEQIKIISDWLETTPSATADAKFSPILLKLRYILKAVKGKLLQKLGL